MTIDIRRALIALPLIFSLAACTPFPKGPHGRFENIDASAAATGDAVPRDEPRSKSGNPDSYVVFGKRYQVLKTAAGYDQKGIASWYGPNFHGHRTSSGEVYDMYAMTAAHKTLPLPTFVRVTNLRNGRSVVVKVNDRGPFHENRIIDLSYAAARKLGIVKDGTGLVDVRAITPGESATSVAAARPEKSAPATAPATGPAADDGVRTAPATPLSSGPRIYLQVGAFADDGNAHALQARLENAHLRHVAIQSVNAGNRTLYKVRIGPIPTVDQVDSITTRLDHMGLGDAQVVIE